MSRTLKERIKRFTDHLPDEIEPEPEEEIDVEIDEEEQDLEYKVITLEAGPAAETIEEMLSDDWTLDDHISNGPHIILIFSRERE